jgi:diguanylate cyclase (GGDEF)-like protein
VKRARKQPGLDEIKRLRERLAEAEQRQAALEAALADARMAQQQLQSYADDFRRTYSESRLRLQHMTALYEVSTGIASTVDPGEVLDRTSKGLGRLLPLDRVAIYLLDDDGKPVLQPLAGNQLAKQDLPGEATSERAALERCLADGWVVSKESEAPAGGTHGGAWTIAVPLSIGDRRLGGLVLVRSGPQPLKDGERRLVEMVAAQSALALQHARLAATDGLTGLYNRRYFEQALDFECERARRAGRPLGLVMADVDRFKRFNDRFGHAAGDEVLRVVAVTFAGQLRRTDTLARVGGEEFMAILPEDNREGVAVAAERVRRAVEQQPPLWLEGYELPPVRISVGGASLPPETVAPRTLMKAADRALRRAKRRGRNRSVVIGTEMAEAT